MVRRHVRSRIPAGDRPVWERSERACVEGGPPQAQRSAGARGNSEKSRTRCAESRLVLRQELQARLEEKGHEFEWADVISDLDRLQMVEVEQDGKRFLLRSEVQGTCGKVFQTVGVAVPPTVQQVSAATPGGDAAHSATPPV